jgi:hypothetical protein
MWVQFLQGRPIINICMSRYWLDYVKYCYDLVVESESRSDLVLDHEIEAHVVHLMARNFERTDIGNTAVAISLMQAINSGSKNNLVSVADECLLIHSYPFRQHRWPSATYYQDMGTTAYGLAGHIMEDHFVPASRVLHSIFRRIPSL